LTGTPSFKFETYPHKDHLVFASVTPVNELPIGSEHTASQYMLQTIHMEEASYEGNDRMLKEWWRQLKLDSPDEQKNLGREWVLVWVGNQLTVSHLRGLQRFRCEDLNSFDRLAFMKPIFGWFHAQIAVEHSLHAEYFGTQTGFGLVQAFDLLNRKGLHAPSIQGTFHHHMKEALYHISEARFRDLWCVVGKVNKIEQLRSLTPQRLYDLATRIVSEYASSSALRRLDTKKSHKDELLYQSTQMARDLLDCLDLDEAIKLGDVGRMEDLLPRLLFRFVDGKNKNYALEILELLQGLHHEWTPELK
jgi:hypothetical protein